MRVPRSVALALAEGSARPPGIARLGSSEEIRAAGNWWTYRSAKARRELGLTTRPHEDTVEATVRFHEELLGDRLLRVVVRQPLAWRLAGRAVREVVR